jgi:hypothetical protein
VDVIADFIILIFTHRRVIRDLAAENLRLRARLEAKPVEAAEPEKEASKPFTVRRKSWQEIAYSFEVDHNQILKSKIEAAKRRREAFDR